MVRRFNVAGWLVVVAVTALAQLLISAGVLDYDYLPAPDAVFSALFDITKDGDLTSALGHTVGVALLASLLACVLGIAIGLAVGLNDAVRTYLLASIDVLRTIPVVAMMPVALLIWGAGAKAEVIVATYAALWPILINTAGAVRSVHPRLHDVSRTFRLSRRDAMLKIVVPAAAPAMLVGARLSVIAALVVAIVAEMLISSTGLGWGLVQSQQALQPAMMWAYAVVCGLLGYLLNLALIHGVRIALPGRRVEGEAA
jgi:ABC-type nitrate/sulfonate/bicarbonate transport system permease component